MEYFAALLGICLVGKFFVRRITFAPFRIAAVMVLMLAGLLCIGMYMNAR